MNEKILNFAKVSTLAVLLAFGITQVSSWTAPTAVPPDGNVSVSTVSSDTNNIGYVDAQVTEGSTSGGGIPIKWGYTDKHYFVTDTKYTGNLGGIAGADAKCNTDANAIPGKSYQVARTTFDPDRNRYVFAQPYVGVYNDTYGWVNSILWSDMTGLVVNNNPSGAGSMFKNIAGGNRIYISASDWGKYLHNTSFDVWHVDTPETNNCNNWTSAPGVQGKVAKQDDNNIGLIDSSANRSCSESHSLLCLEI